MNPNQTCNREQLLCKINEVSFTVNDILLFLDTHPDDENALAFYEKYASERRKLMKEYSELYGPLTVDDALKSSLECWKWAQQPWPWEVNDMSPKKGAWK